MKQSTSQLVPEGYKKTDFDLLPIDWNCVPLGDLVHDVSYGSSAKSRDKGAVPVLRMGNLQDGFIDWTDLVFTSDLSEISKYSLKKNDVLFNRTNTVDLVGKTSIYKGEQPAIYAGYLIKIDNNEELLNSEYLNYVLNTHQTKSYNRLILSVAVSQANINGQKLKTYPIPLPSCLEEQAAIANALSDVDALLGELEKLIAKKQAIKTATMQQLLTGKTRLPQFATYADGDKQGQTKGTKPSELGEIPEDWDVKAFDEVMSIRHGKDQKAVQVVDGLYPIFGTGGKMGTTNIPLYDKPSVLIGRKGTINKPRYADYPFWTVDTLFYSEISSKAVPKFIFYKFCMIDWMQYNEASGVPSLNASTIESVTASFPSKEEQTAIATILSDMDEEIQVLQQRLSKTRQIKQGMMQELLTGRTRLPFEKQ